VHNERSTRRDFLAFIGTGAAIIVVAGCAGTKVATRPVPSGGVFVQPDELRSVNGRLAVTLTAEATMVPFGAQTRFAYTYNGSTPGPTLRVRPGDTVVVTLRNRLGTDTNLHTHGLHVSPSGDSDNIFVMVPPGGEHTYTYAIPADHPSGLFWYHPHAHGHVAEQIAGGLAGAIIVTDDLDDVAEIAGSTERLLILADPRIGSSASVLATSQMDRMQGRQGDVVVINGIAQPSLAVTAGTLERWRILNSSAARYYRLALDGHQLHVMASDGGRLTAPVTASEILLAPGERTEVLVTPTQAGSYRLRALRYDRGSSGMGGGMGGRASGSTTETVIATMNVTGSASAARLPSALAKTSSVIPTISATRTVTLAMGAGGGMGAGSMMAFTIDGKAFDPARTDITARVGTAEEWAIRNTSVMDHPFHLHVWPFRIVDGPPTAGWKDTVNVPAGHTVTIRIAFIDLPGRTVYHCHILDHEDLGMMGTINVTP